MANPNPIATTLPALIQAINQTIADNADEVAELDQAIGDGDHVSNVQRGLQAVRAHSAELGKLDWQAAFQKIGMTVMSTVGGASGSLYGTFFIAMAKGLQNQLLNRETFALAFKAAVEAMKLRGKADKGEKTMLDVLIPVAEVLNLDSNKLLTLPDLLQQVDQTAIQGVETTREMIATKGRASFLGERSKGHIDAGAKSSQLMISAIVKVLQKG